MTDKWFDCNKIIKYGTDSILCMYQYLNIYHRYNHKVREAFKKLENWKISHLGTRTGLFSTQYNAIIEQRNRAQHLIS